MFRLRPATVSDQGAIRALIRQVQINPTGLEWQRFIVAVSEEGRLIGCGQIKPHPDGSRELASIAVAPDWRNTGVATAIISHLGAGYAGSGSGQTPPLYLTCRAGLGEFYQRFGFYPISSDQMPVYFRRVARLANALHNVRLFKEGLLVMKKEMA